MNACPVAWEVEMPSGVLLRRDDVVPSVRQSERRKPNKNITDEFKEHDHIRWLRPPAAPKRRPITS